MFSPLLIKFIKFLIQGAAVSAVAYSIPVRQLTGEEILLIAITSTVTMALLDKFFPEN